MVTFYGITRIRRIKVQLTHKQICRPVPRRQYPNFESICPHRATEPFPNDLALALGATSGLLESAQVHDPIGNEQDRQL
jgi:hypothetical protein